jgi:hypothetical protein
MLSNVPLVRTDVSEERITSIIRVTRIGEQRASVASYCQSCSWLADFYHPDDGGDTIPRNIGSYKSHMANIPEYGILRIHRRKDLKSVIILTAWSL